MYREQGGERRYSGSIPKVTRSAAGRRASPWLDSLRGCPYVAADSVRTCRQKIKGGFGAALLLQVAEFRIYFLVVFFLLPKLV
jgi:hypothetical protein